MKLAPERTPAYTLAWPGTSFRFAYLLIRPRNIPEPSLAPPAGIPGTPDPARYTTPVARPGRSASTCARSEQVRPDPVLPRTDLVESLLSIPTFSRSERARTNPTPLDPIPQNPMDLPRPSPDPSASFPRPTQLDPQPQIQNPQRSGDGSRWIRAQPEVPRTRSRGKDRIEPQPQATAPRGRYALLRCLPRSASAPGHRKKIE